MLVTQAGDAPWERRKEIVSKDPEDGRERGRETMRERSRDISERHLKL